MLFSILGLIGGLLCCVGDILFDLKGAGNKKLGTSKNIDSNWINMAEWRFGASILCAMFGDIGVGFGFFSIANQIKESHPKLAAVMAVTAYAGVIGGFFIHTLLCVQAVIYKRIMSGGEKNFDIAVLCGALAVPKWMALLNSVVFLIIGITMRKIDGKKFQDLPGIIMPSLGLAMVGLIGIVSLI